MISDIDSSLCRGRYMQVAPACGKHLQGKVNMASPGGQYGIGCSYHSGKASPTESEIHPSHKFCDLWLCVFRDCIEPVSIIRAFAPWPIQRKMLDAFFCAASPISDRLRSFGGTFRKYVKKCRLPRIIGSAPPAPPGEALQGGNTIWQDIHL